MLDFDEEKAQRVLKHIGHGNGYAFLAEAQIAEKNYTEAYRLVTRGLQGDSKSLWLIRTEVNLIQQLYPDDYEKLEKALNRYVRLDNTYDIALEFELAILAFKQENYDASYNLFQQLYSRSKSHLHRVTPTERNRWMEDRKPKEFKGEIVQLPQGREYGKISCFSLPKYNHSIDVRKEDIEFECKGREKVIFNIIFNMKGPQASRVRRL